MQRFLLVSTLALFTGCGPAAESIDTGLPSGSFGGSAWTLGKAVVSRADDRLSVTLYSDAEKDVADCDDFAEVSTGYVIWSQPAEEGRRELKLAFGDPDGQTVTFVTPPSDNAIITSGVLEVSALGDTSVTIGLNVTDGDENALNGTFTATLCD